MASFTIKGIPDRLLQRLRERARDERRSLTQQVIVLLERGLERDATAPADQVAEQVAAWRRLAGSWDSDETAEEEARRVYDARTAGRDVEL
jgi:hypothetical protein